MSGKRDIAWVADKLIVQLKASMTQMMSSLTTEYADGVALDAIPTDNYFIAEHRKIPGYPFIAVIPDETDMVPFSGEGNYNIEYHDLMISVIRTNNIDEDLLKRQVLRTVRAVEEVLLNHRTLSGSVDDCLIMRKSYGPMFSAGNSLLQEGQLGVRVMTSNNDD